MAITHTIAHHLVRPAEGEAKLALRSEELSDGERRQVLLDKLKSSFLSRLARKHGSFCDDDDGNPSLLQRELEAFTADQNHFAQLSVTFMNRLEQLVNEKEIGLDNHFLFFVEQAGSQHHVFYLFGVNQTESLAIDDSLEVTPSYAVDTGPSLFGIKVDLAERERKHYTYLTLVHPRGNPALVKIFEQLTGFNDGINKEEATESFLEGVESFAKQVPVEQQESYRAKVVNYCLEREEEDEPLDIKALSRELEGIDREQFVKEISARKEKEEDEIMIDRRALRRYVKFSGREKDLAISFSTYQLNSRVTYDVDNDVLTVNGLPKALREQLLGYLQKDD